MWLRCDNEVTFFDRSFLQLQNMLFIHGDHLLHPGNNLTEIIHGSYSRMRLPSDYTWEHKKIDPVNII